MTIKDKLLSIEQLSKDAHDIAQMLQLPSHPYASSGKDIIKRSIVEDLEATVELATELERQYERLQSWLGQENARRQKRRKRSIYSKPMATKKPVITEKPVSPQPVTVVKPAGNQPCGPRKYCAQQMMEWDKQPIEQVRKSYEPPVWSSSQSVADKPSTQLGLVKPLYSNIDVRACPPKTVVRQITLPLITPVLNNLEVSGSDSDDTYHDESFGNIHPAPDPQYCDRSPMSVQPRSANASSGATCAII